MEKHLPLAKTAQDFQIIDYVFVFHIFKAACN